MKRTSVLYLVLVSLAALVAAWAPEDHEIFRIRDELAIAEGSDLTFYEFIGIPPTASQDEINKAYRKKSQRLHPDKAIPALIAQRFKPKSSKSSSSTNKKPGVNVQRGPTQKERAQIAKEANERYARLGVVANILRGAQRERYDHFLKNGFPRWRGTGYYYARFRPGLGSVVVGLLIVFGGGAHYGAMYIGWKRQREFVQRYVSHARRTAWGNETGIPGIPGMSDVGNPSLGPTSVDSDEQEAPQALNRREKRMQEKESRKKNAGSARTARSVRANGISGPMDATMVSGPQGSKKKVIAENGKVLIVDSVGNVYLEETTEEGEKHEFLLDPEEIPKPSIMQTALFRIPIFAYSQTVGRLVEKFSGGSVGPGPEEPFLDQDGHQLSLSANSGPDQYADVSIDAATAQNPAAETRKRKARAKR